MYSLSFDTASMVWSLGIYAAKGPLVERAWESPFSQGPRLILTIKEMLQEVALSFKDLAFIAVNRGPGSFTGIRLGLSAALGLRLAQQVPVIAFDGFEVSLEKYKTEKALEALPRLVALSSRRRDPYVKLFDEKGQVLKEAQAILPENINTFVPEGGFYLWGEAANELKEVASSCGGVFQPEPPVLASQILARKGFEVLPQKLRLDALIDPFYLTAPGITLSQKR